MDERPTLARSAGMILLAVLAWRGALLCVGFIGMGASGEMHNPQVDYRAFPDSDESPVRKAPDRFPRYLADGFCRWDSGWYARIAERGYTGGKDQRVAFYPAFPYLARWAGTALGTSHWVGGLIVSNLGLYLGLLACYLLTIELLDETRARWAVVWILASPGSFFLSAYLSEGLFLALGAFAMLAYVRQRWWLAGALCCLATLTRPTGTALFAGMAIDHALRLRRGEREWDWHALGLLLGPAGLLIFMGVLQQQVGDPLAFASIQSQWGGRRMMPWDTLIAAFQSIDWRFPRHDPRGVPNTIRFVELLVAGGLLVVPLFMRKRLPPALWAFVLVAAILPLLAGRMQSGIRYAALLFPIWIWVADATAERPWVRAFALHVSSMLLVVFYLGYANWHWVG